MCSIREKQPMGFDIAYTRKDYVMGRNGSSEANDENY